MKEIGLRREIKKMGMYQAEEWEPEDEEMDELEELEHKLAIEFPDYNDIMIKDLAKQIHSSTMSSNKHIEQRRLQEQIAALGEEAEDKKGGKISNKEQKKHDLFLLTTVEALNVDIPENREKFIAYVAEMEMNKTKDKNAENSEKRFYLDEDETPVADEKNEELTDRRHKKRMSQSLLFVYIFYVKRRMFIGNIEKIRETTNLQKKLK